MKAISLTLVLVYVLALSAPAEVDSPSSVTWGAVSLQGNYWENTNRDSDWFFDDSLIKRRSNGKCSGILLKNRIPEYFEMSYELKPRTWASPMEKVCLSKTPEGNSGTLRLAMISRSGSGTSQRAPMRLTPVHWMSKPQSHIKFMLP